MILQAQDALEVNVDKRMEKWSELRDPVMSSSNMKSDNSAQQMEISLDRPKVEVVSDTLLGATGQKVRRPVEVVNLDSAFSNKLSIAHANLAKSRFTVVGSAKNVSTINKEIFAIGASSSLTDGKLQQNLIINPMGRLFPEISQPLRDKENVKILFAGRLFQRNHTQWAELTDMVQPLLEFAYLHARRAMDLVHHADKTTQFAHGKKYTTSAEGGSSLHGRDSKGTNTESGMKPGGASAAAAAPTLATLGVTHNKIVTTAALLEQAKSFIADEYDFDPYLFEEAKWLRSLLPVHLSGKKAIIAGSNVSGGGAGNASGAGNADNYKAGREQNSSSGTTKSGQQPSRASALLNAESESVNQSHHSRFFRRHFNTRTKDYIKGSNVGFFGSAEELILREMAASVVKNGTTLTSNKKYSPQILPDKYETRNVSDKIMQKRGSSYYESREAYENAMEDLRESRRMNSMTNAVSLTGALSTSPVDDRSILSKNVPTP